MLADGRLGERALFHCNLLAQEQRTGLGRHANNVELNFVRNSGMEPRTTNDADLTPVQSEFGNVLSKPDIVINLRFAHDDLRIG